MKHIYILGATGSIGMQTIDVISKDLNHFRLIGVSLGSDDQKNFDILDHYAVEIACLRTEVKLSSYQSKYPKTRFVYGDLGLIEVASYPVQGILVNALSGSSGLRPTVAAIKSGKDIALANKETLVMAGELIKKLVDAHNVKLLPIDSEHSALWQVLQGEEMSHVESLYITASGGSFRHLDRKALEHVTLEDALKHPNWQMGAKITIDSATMMNKGLEVIEAHHLFNIPYQNIKTILHKESLVHGMVYFKDGTIKASLSPSDMRIPIGYALYYPQRVNHPNRLNLTQLSFEPMDEKRFPFIKLAYEVGLLGGLLPTVMNAANEAAVKLFLSGDISFLDIEKIVMHYVAVYPRMKQPTLDDIIQTDEKIQQEIFSTYGKR